jgi:lysozyme family protein
MTPVPELSPQAWAVLNAAYQAPDDGNATRQSVAAALRAGEPMTKLSPQAQAVKDAVLALYSDEKVRKFGWQLDVRTVAAALRAAADQAHPKAHIEDIDYVHQSYVDGWKDALDVILAIATELEAQ